MRVARWKFGFAAMAAGLTLAWTAPTSHALAVDSGVYSTNFVDGGGTVTDDWGDHFSELGHSLCYGCADSSNTHLVVMWQAILAAEGFLSVDDIDAQFGPATKAATISWQRRYGLTADGYVGNATWSKADDRLRWDGLEWDEFVVYDATGPGDVDFHRGNSDDPSHPRDGGAYRMTGVDDGDKVRWFGSSRIYFHQR